LFIILTPFEYTTEGAENAEVLWISGSQLKRVGVRLVCWLDTPSVNILEDMRVALIPHESYRADLSGVSRARLATRSKGTP
jgi:hypothetical protein